MKIAIISGGDISIEWARAFFEKENFDYIVCADGGMKTAIALDLYVDYFTGDFDSIEENAVTTYKDQNKNTLVIDPHSSIKDETDTENAICHAIDTINQSTSTHSQRDEIYIIGGLGGRFDHALINVYLLEKLLKQGIDSYIVDPWNRIRMIKQSIILKKDEQYGKYVSLIAYSDEVGNITLKGFKYPLTNRSIKKSDSLTISNEIEANEGQILFEGGIFIVIESRDA